MTRLRALIALVFFTLSLFFHFIGLGFRGLGEIIKGGRDAKNN